MIHSRSVDAAIILCFALERLPAELFPGSAFDCRDG